MVGLAPVGVPPLEYCEPPLPPCACSCTPPVALGAVTPPPEVLPPPLLSPRLSLRWTRGPPPSIDAPVSKPPPGCRGVVASVVPGGASTLLLVLVPLGAGVPRWVCRRFAIGVFAVDEPVLVVVEFVRAGRQSRRRDPGCAGKRRRRFRRQQFVGPGEADSERGDEAKAGQGDDRCKLVSHAVASLYPPARNMRSLPGLSLRNRHAQTTGSYMGAQRLAAAPNTPLIKAAPCAHRRQGFNWAGCAG